MISCGTPIAAIAPSGAYRDDRLQTGLAIARAAGRVIHVLEPTSPHRYLAGSDAERRANSALSGPSEEGTASPDCSTIFPGIACPHAS